MADRNLTLGVTTDEATIANAKKRLQELESAQKRLAAAQAKYAGDSSKAGKAIQDGIAKQSKELTNEQKRLERALQKTNKAFIDQQSAAGRAAKGVEAAKTASGSAPVDSSKQLTSIGRNIRNLPSIRVPGVGIGTDTFGRAAEVAGKLGVTVGAMGTALAVGIPIVAALAIGFGEYTKRALAAREVQKAYTESLKETIDLLNSEKGTSEAVAEQERELKQNIKNAEDHAAALRKVREARNEENNVIQDIFTKSRILAGGTRKQLNEDINAGDDSVDQATAALEAFYFAMDDGTIAANDAAAAEKALAEARTAAVLQEADQAGELASLKARAAELTQEQIDNELEALEIRKTGLEAELASLEASGDKSEEVAKKIDQLRESLGFLGEQSDVLKTARRTARSSEADKAAEKAAKDAEKAQQDRQREAEKAANDAIKAQDQLADKLAEARQNFSDKLKDIALNLVDKFEDINRKFEDESLEDSIKFNQDEQKEERQHQRELARIRQDAKDSEADAVRQRDFAAAAAARKQGSKAVSDKQQQEADENAEQQLAFEQDQQARERERDIERREADIDAKRARRDARIARDRSIRDAQATYQDTLQIQNQFGTAFVGNFKTMFDSVLQMQAQLGGGSKTTTSKTTQKSSGTSMSFDDMQFMIASGG